MPVSLLTVHRSTIYENYKTAINANLLVNFKIASSTLQYSCVDLG